jgi:hypothetical protein
MSGNASFVHRFNQNGTHDSICRGCFVTVASLGDEAELVRHERDHLCGPMPLNQVREDPSLASWLREISFSTMHRNRAHRRGRFVELS